MFHEFASMRVRNMLPKDYPHKVELQLPSNDGKGDKRKAETKPDGTFFIPLVHPLDESRHLALGRFMDAWSRLELALSMTLSGLLGIELGKLTALTNSLGTKGLLDVISAHAQSKLSETLALELAKFIERVRENNTRRNYLAHGAWTLEWTVMDHGGKPAALSRAYRMYAPSDPIQAKLLEDPKNRKERLKYMFAPKRIEAIAKSVLNLTVELQAFTQANCPMIPERLKEQGQRNVTSRFIRTARAEPAAQNILAANIPNPFKITNHRIIGHLDLLRQVYNCLSCEINWGAAQFIRENAGSVFMAFSAVSRPPA